jgi:hypothetical protein
LDRQAIEEARPMQLLTAEVRGGTIVPPEGVELPEGTRVVVILDDDEAGFELSAAEEASLSEAIAEADRGEVISASELFRRLKGR